MSIIDAWCTAATIAAFAVLLYRYLVGPPPDRRFSECGAVGMSSAAVTASQVRQTHCRHGAAR